LDFADEYSGKSGLWLMLIIGAILAVVGLVIIDYEVKCELKKKKEATSQTA